MHPPRTHSGQPPAEPPADPPLAGRGRDETYSFILRLRLFIAGEGGRSRVHFSVEDVAAGRTEQFASFALAAQHLEARIHEIVPGPGQ